MAAGGAAVYVFDHLLHARLCFAGMRLDLQRDTAGPLFANLNSSRAAEQSRLMRLMHFTLLGMAPCTTTARRVPGTSRFVDLLPDQFHRLCKPRKLAQALHQTHRLHR